MDEPQHPLAPLLASLGQASDTAMQGVFALCATLRRKNVLDAEDIAAICAAMEISVAQVEGADPAVAEDMRAHIQRRKTLLMEG